MQPQQTEDMVRAVTLEGFSFRRDGRNQLVGRHQEIALSRAEFDSLKGRGLVEEKAEHAKKTEAANVDTSGLKMEAWRTYMGDKQPDDSEARWLFSTPLDVVVENLKLQAAAQAEFDARRKQMLDERAQAEAIQIAKMTQRVAGVLDGLKGHEAFNGLRLKLDEVLDEIARLASKKNLKKE